MEPILAKEDWIKKRPAAWLFAAGPNRRNIELSNVVISKTPQIVKREREDYEVRGLAEAIASNHYDPSQTENPPPDEKWKAKDSIHCFNLNGAESAVMWCLIDCANSRTDLCYPGQQYMAGLLDLPPRTVKRAIAKLKKRGLIRIVRRGRGSNRYYIIWPPLFDAFAKMEAFRAKRTKVALQNSHDGPKLAPYDGP